MIKGFKRAYKFSEFIDECMIPDSELTLDEFKNRIRVGCFFRVSNDIYMICDINGINIIFQTYTSSYIKDEIYRYESHNEFRTLNIYSLFELVKTDYLRGFKDTFYMYSTKTNNRLIKINQIFN